MSDTIAVALVAQDSQFIATTKQAAANMATLAVQETKLADAAKALGVDGKKFSAEYSKVEAKRIQETSRLQKTQALADKKATEAAAKKTKADAKEKEKADKKAAAEKAKAEKKAADEITRAEAKRTTLNQKLARIILGRKALIIGEASGIGKIGVATVELGGALVGATVAAAGLLAGLAAIAVKTSETRQNTKEWFDILTGGRGAQTLALVDQLAGQLGIKFQTAREQFEQFRQAGLDNKQSANLIKLAADLDAVDRSGKKSAEAIERVLSYASNGPQTAEQAAAASKAMALLAKQAGVAGDGTNAVADAAKSLTGAWNKIDNTKTKALEQLGDRITPGLERAAQAIATIVDDFYKSKDGQKTIEAVAVAVEKLADAAVRAAPAVRDLVNAQNVQKGSDLLGELASAAGEVVSAAWEIPKAFWIVGNNIYDATKWIITKVENLGSYIADNAGKWASSAKQWGANVVNGLITGIEGAAGRLYDKVAAMGKQVKTAFADVLGIHSPSRVFVGFGMNIGRGAEIGIDRAMPTGAEIAARMIPANDNAVTAAPFMSARVGGAAVAGAPGVPSGAPGLSGSLDIRIVVEHGTPPASIDEQVSAAMESWWQRKSAQSGAAA